LAWVDHMALHFEYYCTLIFLSIEEGFSNYSLQVALSFCQQKYWDRENSF